MALLLLLIMVSRLAQGQQQRVLMIDNSYMVRNGLGSTVQGLLGDANVTSHNSPSTSLYQHWQRTRDDPSSPLAVLLRGE